MDQHLTRIAETCLDAAERNSMDFPAIVGALMQAGFESYTVDFRRSTATYFLPDGDSIMLPTRHGHRPVAAALDMAGLRAAIAEAQRHAPGYTYAGFCAKAMAAGCAGYMVSFLGRRAVYFGRTGETHVEAFPPAAD